MIELENNMITAKGLEDRLRELRCWTKFQNNNPSISDKPIKLSYYNMIVFAFFFDKTKEGHDFWWNIADKIDKVKL